MHHWQKEVNRLIAAFGAVTLAGLLFGAPLPFLLLACMAYIGYNLRQLNRICHWLSGSRAGKLPPPEGIGLWGGVFDSLHRLHQERLKAGRRSAKIVKRARESSSALALGIVLIDAKDCLDWWNPACRDLLGLRHPQDRGQPVGNLLRDPAFGAYFHQEDYRQPLTLAAPRDAGRMLEIEITPFGKRERLMLVRDITQLHRLDRIRREFVGNVSHELGTPITVLKGYLETFSAQRDELPERWHQPLRHMRRHTERMENIVKDLLLLSTLEANGLGENLEAVDLESLLREVRDSVARMFADAGHRYEVSCPPRLRLRGKRDELHGAIANLAVNAAKYTPAGGRISLRAGLEGDHAVIVVEDDGIGIEARHLPRLTERFYRVDDSRSPNNGGTGLGLAIVKHVLSRHGGRLRIHSQVGAGSRFTCELPASLIAGRPARGLPDETVPPPPPSPDTPAGQRGLAA